MGHRNTGVCDLASSKGISNRGQWYQEPPQTPVAFDRAWGGFEGLFEELWKWIVLMTTQQCGVFNVTQLCADKQLI